MRYFLFHSKQDPALVKAEANSIIKAWEGNGFALGDEVRGYLVSDEESFDIDTPFEMELFEGIIHLREEGVKVYE